MHIRKQHQDLQKPIFPQINLVDPKKQKRDEATTLECGVSVGLRIIPVKALRFIDHLHHLSRCRRCTAPVHRRPAPLHPMEPSQEANEPQHE